MSRKTGLKKNGSRINAYPKVFLNHSDAIPEWTGFEA